MFTYKLSFTFRYIITFHFEVKVGVGISFNEALAKNLNNEPTFVVKQVSNIAILIQKIF